MAKKAGGHRDRQARRERDQASRARRRARDVRRGPSAPATFTEFGSPLAGLSPEDRTMVLAELGAGAAADFDALLPAVEQAIADLSPLDVLAHYALYGLGSRDGTSEREWTEEQPCLQHHVELMQALALRRRGASTGGKVLVPRDVGGLFPDVVRLTQAFPMRRLAARVGGPADAGAPAEERESDRQIAELRLVEAMRAETQAVRNPGYPHQLRAVLERLFAPLEAEIERALGVRVGGLVAMWFNVIDLIQQRTRDFLGRIQAFRRHRHGRQMLAAFSEAFPDAPSANALLADPRCPVGDATEMRWFLQAHADAFLWRVFALDVDDFVRAYAGAAAAPPTVGGAGTDGNVPGGAAGTGVDGPTADAGAGPGTSLREALRRVLTMWSLPLGALASAEPEHFFLSNPVWRKPLVALGDDRYFLPVVTTFFAFAFEQIEALVLADPALRERYERRRAEFLEEEAARLLAGALPGATVLRGSMWTDPATGREYENDVLVLLDGHVLVVEAKAGRVTEPARRGAPGRLRDTIAKLIADSALQASRFAEYLREHPGPHALRTRRGDVNTFDTSGARHIAPVCVTLDHLGLTGIGLRELQRAGALDPALELAPVLTVWDLHCVVDLLDHPAEVLHYLTRRGQLERDLQYQGDETDLLGFYLATGFNVGTAERSDVAFMLAGHHRLIEPWFVGRWTRRAVKKPRAARSRWFERILARLEDRRPNGWTGISHTLLNVAPEDQATFERATREALASTRRLGYGPQAKNFVILLSGPEHRRDLIVAVALTARGRGERREQFARAIGQARADHPDLPVLAVGLDCRAPQFPYDIIGLVEAHPPTSPDPALGRSVGPISPA